MTLKEYADRIKNAISNIAEDRQKNAIIYANDLISLINLRLINEGVGADGVKFPLYSDKNLGEFIAGSNIAKSNKSQTNKGRSKGGRSYKELRQLMGLPVNRRTHSFNGDMLKSVEGVIIEHDASRTVVEIDAKDEFNKNKVRWNSNLVGISILKANPDERKMVEDANRERIRNILKNIISL